MSQPNVRKQIYFQSNYISAKKKKKLNQTKWKKNQINFTTRFHHKRVFFFFLLHLNSVFFISVINMYLYVQTVNKSHEHYITNSMQKHKNVYKTLAHSISIYSVQSTSISHVDTYLYLLYSLVWFSKFICYAH